MRIYDEHDYDEDRGLSLPVIYTIIAVAGIILVILLIVLTQNSPKKKSGATLLAASPTPTEQTEDIQFSEGEKDLESLYRNHELRAEDLDFWDMYGEDKVVEAEATPTPTATPEVSPSPSPSPENEKIKKNNIIYTNLEITNDQMAYYLDGEKHSWLGVELSKNSGQVDFDWLKRNGVDFVMLKIGGRGYESGVISADDKFTDFIEAAKKAELGVGVYFSSQAITVKEAVEEAEFVTTTLQGYRLDYPVAYTVETIANDDARTDLLDKDEKSQVAEAFLKTVKDAGYQTILYGNEQWLLEEIQPDELLENYDVMLNNTSSIPEYPYQFKMWKYANNKTIAGIESGGSYIISFVDYSAR